MQARAPGRPLAAGHGGLCTGHGRKSARYRVCAAQSAEGSAHERAHGLLQGIIPRDLSAPSACAQAEDSHSPLCPLRPQVVLLLTWCPSSCEPSALWRRTRLMRSS